MKKVILLILVLATLLCGCGKEKSKITEKEAMDIALKDLNVSSDRLGGIHVHTGELQGDDCFLVYVTVDGKTTQYIIRMEDGKILHTSESDHSH